MWTVLERTEDYALMEQKSMDGSYVVYNVIKVIKAPEARLGKNFIPAKEKIPADSQWGTYGWNFGGNLNKAKERFKELTK